MKYPPQLLYSPGVEECRRATVARVNKPRITRETSSIWRESRSFRRFVEAGVTGERKKEE